MADITLAVVEESPIELTYVEAAIKPEQTKDVTPSYEAQTVLPDDGMTLGRVNVAAIPDPTTEINITENGDYNVARIGTAHVDVQPTLDSATVTPTEQTQRVTSGQGYDGLSEVVVEPIPSEYVVPTGSVEITENGEKPVAGKATAIVNVPGIVPTGTKQISITQNGTTTHDVTQYASAEIVTDVNTDPEKGFVFGDYDSDGYPTVGRFVGNWTAIPTYFLTASTITEITKKMTVYINSNIKAIGDSAFRTTNINIVFERGLETIGLSCFENNNKISNLHIPDTIIEIKTRAFNTLAALKTVSYAGNVPNIANGVFKYSNAVEVYDFSYATAIPTLYDTASLGHANGCVLKIPSALSDTTLGTGNGWESATNWSALTNIVWEVV